MIFQSFEVTESSKKICVSMQMIVQENGVLENALRLPKKDARNIFSKEVIQHTAAAA